MGTDGMGTDGMGTDGMGTDGMGDGAGDWARTGETASRSTTVASQAARVMRAGDGKTAPGPRSAVNGRS
jgi:hypothetical protein